MDTTRWLLLAAFFACMGTVAYLNLTHRRRMVARELRRIISEVAGVAPSAIRMGTDLSALIPPAQRQKARDMIGDQFGFCQVDRSLFEKGPLMMYDLVTEIGNRAAGMAKVRGVPASYRRAVRAWVLGVLLMTLAGIAGLSVHPALGLALLGATAVVAFVWHVVILVRCRGSLAPRDGTTRP